MKFLPWTVCENDSAVALDSSGCIAVDLRNFGSTGSGHDPASIVEFLVSSANENMEEIKELKT